MKKQYIFECDTAITQDGYQSIRNEIEQGAERKRAIVLPPGVRLAMVVDIEDKAFATDADGREIYWRSVEASRTAVEASGPADGPKTLPDGKGAVDATAEGGKGDQLRDREADR